MTLYAQNSHPSVQLPRNLFLRQQHSQEVPKDKAPDPAAAPIGRLVWLLLLSFSRSQRHQHLLFRDQILRHYPRRTSQTRTQRYQHLRYHSLRCQACTFQKEQFPARLAEAASPTPLIGTELKVFALFLQLRKSHLRKNQFKKVHGHLKWNRNIKLHLLQTLAFGELVVLNKTEVKITANARGSAHAVQTPGTTADVD